MAASTKTFSAMVALAVLSTTVSGHGYMSAPAVELTITGDTTQLMAAIESSASGFSGTFNSDPATNTASFTKAFAASDYTSLREFVEDRDKVVESDFTITCGYTNPDETAQPLPDTYVEWSHSPTEGFTSSYEGSCEVWCDEVRVFQDDNCAADYTTAPAKLLYDHDACLGASQLSFYWLALHSSTWQVYINCAALEPTTSTGATSSYALELVQLDHHHVGSGYHYDISGHDDGRSYCHGVCAKHGDETDTTTSTTAPSTATSTTTSKCSVRSRKH